MSRCSLWLCAGLFVAAPACDDVTPVSIELVFSESDPGAPFANIQTLIFSASDDSANAISQSFSVQEDKLELPVIPYGDNWVFSLEGRFGETPIAFGKSVPVTLASQQEVAVKVFFGQINAFHIPPSQPAEALDPLLISGLPPFSVGACDLGANEFGFIGLAPRSFHAAKLSFVEPSVDVSRVGSTCTSLFPGSLVIGGVLDESATEFSEELGWVSPEAPETQRMVSPNLARIGHQTNVLVIPAGETITLPDGTTLTEGTSLVFVSGGKNNQQIFEQVSLIIVTPDHQLSLYEPTDSAKRIFMSPRMAHSATLIQNENKLKLMVAGGFGKNGELLLTTECLDLSTFAVEPGAPMSEPRAGHTAILAKNGDVLLIGGQNALRESSASIERFSPRFGEFVSEPAMLFTRQGHSATLLESGLILIAGGLGKRVGTLSADQPLSSGELFNPDDSTQSGTLFTRSMNEPRIGHAAVLLPNGLVLLVGGTQDPTQNAELYIPVPGEP